MDHNVTIEPDYTLVMHHCRSLRGLGLSPDQYMAAITEFHKALTNQALAASADRTPDKGVPSGQAVSSLIHTWARAPYALQEN
jgi:hypothetical protein